MRKAPAVVLALLSMLVLCACAPAPAPAETPAPGAAASAPAPSPVPGEPPAETPKLVDVTLYLPDESATGLLAQQARAEDSPRGLLAALVAAGALPDVNFGRNLSCSAEREALIYEGETYSGMFVCLDLSDAFAEAVKAAGADGERLILQSLVNTFLARYGADALLLSIEGTDLETMSGRYDRPIAFDELVKTRASDTPAP